MTTRLKGQSIELILEDVRLLDVDPPEIDGQGRLTMKVPIGREFLARAVYDVIRATCQVDTLPGYEAPRRESLAVEAYAARFALIKTGLPFTRVHFHCRYSELNLHVEMEVRDREGKGDAPIGVSVARAFSWPMIAAEVQRGGADALVEVMNHHLRRILTEVLVHELEETILFAGERLYDPHATKPCIRCGKRLAREESCGCAFGRVPPAPR